MGERLLPNTSGWWWYEDRHGNQQIAATIAVTTPDAFDFILAMRAVHDTVFHDSSDPKRFPVWLGPVRPFGPQPTAKTDSQPETKICPVCNGSGAEEIPFWDEGDRRANGPFPFMMGCRSCGATGKTSF